MKFDWDEKKARENIKNHGGVTFEEASAVLTTFVQLKNTIPFILKLTSKGSPELVLE